MDNVSIAPFFVASVPAARSLRSSGGQARMRHTETEVTR